MIFNIDYLVITEVLMSEAIKKNGIQVKYATVGNNGQVSIGKEFAGRQVQIEKTGEGLVIISPGKFIPDHQATFFTKQAMDELQEFDNWASTNQPQGGTDVKALRSKLKGLRGKK
jgi:hypothetical protein